MTSSKACYAWIGPSNGYAALYWHRDSKPSSDYDWIGLYSDQSKGENDYLTWQSAEKVYYVTGEIIRDKLSVRFYRWQDGTSTYVEQMRSDDVNLEYEVIEERTINPGSWITCSSSGYAVLNWTERIPVESRDWVGLYADVGKGNGDYITWQWVEGSCSYTTSNAFVPNMQARYIRDINGSYIALRRSKPIPTGYLDVRSVYNLQDGRLLLKADVGAIVDIMVDQLKKAVNGDPSIFAVGIWPLTGDNLLYKNLSYEEVKVIHAELPISRYYEVIMIYYDTYKMAIQIADDSERNAKRHAFWQISLVRQFGKEFANKLGSAHERGRPGTIEDDRVDELNNSAAILFAETHPEYSPSAAADIMWSSGMLTGYNANVAPAHTNDEL